MLYDDLYQNRLSVSKREEVIYKKIQKYLSDFKVSDQNTVLEIGAGRGFNYTCHPKYVGVEYSSEAVEVARKRYGVSVPVVYGDACCLGFEDGSFDFIFTFATLEHIPDVDAAIFEIARTLRKNGVAILAPAWNCRIWTVQKLEQRPYKSLSLFLKLQKLLIPIRDLLLYRFLMKLPRRLACEFLGSTGRTTKLKFQQLPVDDELIETYGHVPDDNAYCNIDAHEVILWFRSRGFEVISHKTFVRRLFCRGEPVIVRKVS
jgi:SAM-dependent methyltransferase